MFNFDFMSEEVDENVAMLEAQALAEAEAASLDSADDDAGFEYYDMAGPEYPEDYLG